MSFAEVIVRLAAALVGWMAVYAYVLWLATLPMVSCTTDGNTLWAVLLGFGCMAAPLAWLLKLTQPLGEAHSMLKHAVWPLVVLTPFALVPVWSAWTGSTLGEAPLCPSTAVDPWHAWWAPVQTVLLVCVGWQLFRTVRPTAAEVAV